jgi:hypothetical protein
MDRTPNFPLPRDRACPDEEAREAYVKTQLDSIAPETLNRKRTYADPGPPEPEKGSVCVRHLPLQVLHVLVSHLGMRAEGEIPLYPFYVNDCQDLDRLSRCRQTWWGKHTIVWRNTDARNVYEDPMFRNYRFLLLNHAEMGRIRELCKTHKEFNTALMPTGVYGILPIGAPHRSPAVVAAAQEEAVRQYLEARTPSPSRKREAPEQESAHRAAKRPRPMTWGGETFEWSADEIALD